nr:MAG TPA: hypothetical protein [Caudoviricetes sp.]
MKKNKEKKYIDACQRCTLPASKCKGSCTRKQIIQNSQNGGFINGKQQTS